MQIINKLAIQHEELLLTKGFIEIEDLRISPNSLTTIIAHIPNPHIDTGYPILGIYKPKGCYRSNPTCLRKHNKCYEVDWTDTNRSKLLLFSNVTCNDGHYIYHWAKDDSNITRIGNLYSTGNVNIQIPYNILVRYFQPINCIL